eukprot:EG_transcript_12460
MCSSALAVALVAVLMGSPALATYNTANLPPAVQATPVARAATPREPASGVDRRESADPAPSEAYAEDAPAVSGWWAPLHRCGPAVAFGLGLLSLVASLLHRFASGGTAKGEAEIVPLKTAASTASQPHGPAPPAPPQPWAMAASTAVDEARLQESLLASAEDARALAALLEEHWDFISRSPALVERLQESANKGDVAAQRVIAGVDAIVDRLFDKATDTLNTLMACDGLDSVDRTIGAMAPKRLFDQTFLRVLDYNLKQAKAAGDTGKAAFFTHVRARCVEASNLALRPAQTLLTQLLRQTAPAEREQTLVEFLLPITSQRMPIGVEVLLDPPIPPKVSVEQLVEGLSEGVAKLRSIDTDPAAVAGSLADLQLVAGMARPILSKVVDAGRLTRYDDEVAKLFA